VNEILKWIASFESDWDKFEASTKKRLARAEASLIRRILADFLPGIGLENGRIKTVVSNYGKANIIDRVLLEFAEQELDPIIRAYTEKVLKIPDRNADYYFMTGADAKKVREISKDIEGIKRILGIGDDGRPVSNGFIASVSRPVSVRQAVKQYVLTAIATGQPIDNFVAGVKQIVSGGEGILNNHFSSFARDVYARVREVNNGHFASSLGMRYFVYQGGLIKTSRKFCISKNGKVFSTEEAERDWPKDADLIDKKTLSAYRPLIDRGRYNCRHFLMYISDKKAEQLKKNQK